MVEEISLPHGGQEAEREAGKMLRKSLFLGHSQ
jgi:hypothetical protein